MDMASTGPGRDGSMREREFGASQQDLGKIELATKVNLGTRGVFDKPQLTPGLGGGRDLAGRTTVGAGEECVKKLRCRAGVLRIPFPASADRKLNLPALALGSKTIRGKDMIGTPVWHPGRGEFDRSDYAAGKLTNGQLSFPTCGVERDDGLKVRCDSATGKARDDDKLVGSKCGADFSFIAASIRLSTCACLDRRSIVSLHQTLDLMWPWHPQCLLRA
ncbi:hypothetical protein ANO11243_068200 [Dothideomycetidae sp. 11243]|nr:hypothetical protein ANO11243_068200 [fungal sp. No.11243]